METFLRTHWRTSALCSTSLLASLAQARSLAARQRHSGRGDTHCEQCEFERCRLPCTVARNRTSVMSCRRGFYQDTILLPQENLRLTVSRELEVAHQSSAPLSCYSSTASRRCLWMAVSGVASVTFIDV